MDSSQKTVESGRRTRLPLVDYTSVKYSDRLPAVLIFGSEATGLSHEAYELAARHNGLRVHIPLSGGVESLNLAAAAAVIAFEIRRQLVESDGNRMTPYRTVSLRGSVAVYLTARYFCSASGSSQARLLLVNGVCLPYRILKQRTDADLIAQLDELMHAGATRRQVGKAILEGRRLISDAIYAKMPVEAVLFTETKHMEGLPLVAGNPPLIQIHPTQMARWSSVKTAPGTLAIVHVSEPESLVDEASTGKVPFYAVLDNVVDPTNLGSVVRVLAAASCSGILVTKGCCDAWCSAALRGGMGAHFRIPIKSHVDWDSIPGLIPRQSAIFLLESAAFDQIPLHGMIDGSLARERIVDESQLARLSYDEPNYPAHAPVVLVVGGGVKQGLNVKARILAEELGGMRIHVPIDSHSAVALHPVAAVSVIAFEIRKQFLSNCQNE